MRICVLCSSHNATAKRIFEREAQSFVSLGHHVTIIASHEDKKAEINTEIKIIALTRRRGLIARFYKNIVLMIKGFRLHADIWYCHELDSLLIGILLKFFKGGKLVFDCHEYYPEKKKYQWGKKHFRLGILAYAAMRCYERFFYRFSDALVAVNQHMADRLAKIGKPVFVLPNYPVLAFAEGQKQYKKKIRVCSSKTLIYAGSITRLRNIHQLVRVLAILRKRFDLDVNLAVYGKGSNDYISEIIGLAKELGVSDRLIIDRLAPQDVHNILCKAAIGMFLLDGKDESHHWREPTKFFEYAAAGIPVIFSDLPAKRRLVEKFGNGYLVDPEKELEVARQCVKLLTDEEKRKSMGESGRLSIYNGFHWEAFNPIVKELFAVLQSKESWQGMD